MNGVNGVRRSVKKTIKVHVSLFLHCACARLTGPIFNLLEIWNIQEIKVFEDVLCVLSIVLCKNTFKKIRFFQKLSESFFFCHFFV